MVRRIVLSTGLVLLASTLSLAQRQAPSPRQTTELVIKVTFDNDRGVPDQVRIQLLNSSGVPVAETFTRGEGEARFLGIEAGSYRIKASSPDIEEKMSDYPFIINPRQLSHFEYFSVRRRASAQQQTSTQGTISAAALNIPPRAEAEFDRGVVALKKNDMAEARKRFQKAVDHYPRYAAAFNNLGVIAMQEGNLEGGATFFRQAVQVDTEYAPPYLNLAKVSMGAKSYPQALDLLTKASSIDPTNAEVLALLTMVEYESNRLELAVANARKVHALPDHARFAFAHMIAGRSLEAQNRRQEALVEYKLFLQEAPQSPSAAQVRSAVTAMEAARP